MKTLSIKTIKKRELCLSFHDSFKSYQLKISKISSEKFFFLSIKVMKLSKAIPDQYVLYFSYAIQPQKPICLIFFLSNPATKNHNVYIFLKQSSHKNQYIIYFSQAIQPQKPVCLIFFLSNPATKNNISFYFLKQSRHKNQYVLHFS